MKVQTLSVVVGTAACNAKCPFCISKMTGRAPNLTNTNRRNLFKAITLAKSCGVNTAIITGKGEPTLYADDVLDTCQFLAEHFPLVELQTNGSRLDFEYCKELYQAGISTIALSIVDVKPENNNRVYGHKSALQIDKLIDRIHEIGISVRLCCMLAKGFIDTPLRFKELVKFCQDHNIEQLTVRTIDYIDTDTKQAKWVRSHSLPVLLLSGLETSVKDEGTLLMTLPHGGKVYDYYGQNICFGNCLTRDDNPENIRQLIYMNGHVYYDWALKGAILF
jgi:molybdenum cofactor biosynthesis enzyme MoaA